MSSPEKEFQLNIRYGTPADNTLLAKLGAQTFAETFARDNTPENMNAYLASSFSPEKQAEELAQSSSSFLIVELRETALGYARLKLGAAPADVPGINQIEIVRFYVGKEWIGKGVAGALMKACLNEAEANGCDVIWLDVWEHNPRAIAFYRKWDFEEVGTQPFKLGEDIQTDLVMMRPVKKKN